ncbi:MAG: C40 family peptidase [Acetatifactor sp.]|nr:C40 family peptidase [Acetatifactor sp.]
MKGAVKVWGPDPGGRLSAAVLLGAAVCCLAMIAVQVSWIDYARQSRRESESEAEQGSGAAGVPEAGQGSEAAAIPEAGPESESGTLGEAAARYALRFLGTPYVWGGDSLTEGVDCSGFVMSVYRHFQVSLPHSAEEDREAGYEVDGLENAQPGDLICYDDPGHVAIYLGEGRIVHATLSEGVCISGVDFGEISAVRRIF